MQPPTDRWFSNETVLSVLVSVLAGLTACWAVFVAVSQWHSYRVVGWYDADPTRDLSDADRADLIATVAYLGLGLFLLATGTLLVLWLWRVRWNSELFCQAAHRRARAWVIAGWLCPGVNLWVPKQLVDDVLLASDPRTPARLPALEGLRPPAVTLGWWLPWLAALGTGLFAWVVLAGNDSAGELLAVAVLGTVAAAAVAVSAVFLVLIVKQVGETQLRRPWTPWWATNSGRRVTDR